MQRQPTTFDQPSTSAVRHIAQTLPAAWLFLWMIGVAIPALAAEDPNTKLVTGLAQRRMHDLAVLHLQDRLSSKRITPREVADLTVLQLRVQTEYAQGLATDQQPAAFDQARKTADDFFHNHSQNPRQLLVLLQAEQIGIAQGELAKLSFGLGEPVQDRDRAELRESIGGLEKLDRELTQTIPQQFQKEGGKRPLGENFSAEELLALQIQLRQQLARAYTCQAGLYEPGSADWKNGLLHATEILEGALQLLPAIDLRRAKLLIMREALRRELREEITPWVEIERALGMDPESLPLDLYSLWQSELLRRCIASQERQQGAEIIARMDALLQNANKETGDGGSLLSIEWDFARLEFALAGLRFIKTTSASPDSFNRQRDAVTRELKRIERERGEYWSRRARQLLAKDLPASGGGEDITGLQALAEGAMRNQDWPSARRFFLQASIQAAGSGQLEEAADFAFRAAQLLQKEKEYARASEAFLQVAEKFSSQKPAAEAHLAAIWNLGQLAAKDSAAAQKYQQLLQEHIRLFPNASTSPQAHLWQGRLAEAQKDWPLAVAAYQTIPSSHPQFDSILSRLLFCQRQALMESKADVATARKLGRSFAEHLEGLLVPAEDASSAEGAISWNAWQKQVAIELSDLWLEYVPEKVAEIEPMLQAALNAPGDADVGWQGKAQVQIIRSYLVIPGKEQQITQELQSLLQDAPEQVGPLVESLASMLEEGNAARKGQLASLLLTLLDGIEKRPDYNAQGASATKWSIYRAQSYLAKGDRAAAQKLLTQLAKSLPRDAKVQVLLAKCLSSGPTTDQQLALGQWRLVASRAKAHTVLWYEAKYEIARLQIHLGKKEEAAQLIAYLLETPPGISDANWKDRFALLLTIAQAK